MIALRRRKCLRRPGPIDDKSGPPGGGARAALTPLPAAPVSWPGLLLHDLLYEAGPAWCPWVRVTTHLVCATARRRRPRTGPRFYELPLRPVRACATADTIRWWQHARPAPVGSLAARLTRRRQQARVGSAVSRLLNKLGCVQLKEQG
jgi:hypothetical protein